MPDPSIAQGRDSLVEAYTNKIVRFRFQGKDLSFRLSHALFSSFDIDEGTRLLLKSIAQRIDLGRIRSALDIGCGIGVAGACIRAASPGCAVLLQDRDALAAAFAKENWRENDLGDVAVDCGLGFWHIGGRSFDLVISNLPAKAGRPVLESFFRHALACLANGGMAAVVIVAPLADVALSAVRNLGCSLHHAESSRNYTVLHFSTGNANPTVVEQEDLGPYIRARSSFAHRGTAYELETAFSLPDFDTMGHGLSLQLELISDLSGVADVLVWNPGQGHVPAFLFSRQTGLTGLSIASRDALECEITRRNMTLRGLTPVAVRTAPSEICLPEAFAGRRFDLLCAEPHPTPRVPWQAALRESAFALLKAGGRLCISGTSTEIHRFLDQTSGFRLLATAKHAGFRAAVLARL
jgi:SAM-dependent methyltransferase